MLDDETKAVIDEEERFRQRVRSAIAQEQGKKSPWNSLEIVKIIASTFTPIVLLWFGYMVTESQRKNQQNFEATQRANQQNFEESQRMNQRVIEKRIAIYDQVGTKLNDIYCYYTLVGNWKEIKPPDLIANKRSLDKIMYTYRPLFSDKLFSSYNQFIDSTFETFNDIGEDAKLRTTTEERKIGAVVMGHSWKKEWDSRFTEEDNFDEVDSTYKELMANFAAELGLNINPNEGSPKRPPPTKR